MDKKQKGKINVGLTALLADAKPEQNNSARSNEQGQLELSLTDISRSAYQPRTKFDESNIDDLVRSIREHGVLSPILVRSISSDNGRFEIVAGERRYRAALKLNLKTIPVVIKDISDEVALAYALVENIQREALTPLEEGAAYKKLINEFDLTHQEVSDKVGRSRSAITNTLRLLDLGDYAKEYLEAGYLEMGHARTLLGLGEDQQIEAVNKIVNDKLNVRQTEQLVQRIKNPTQKKITLLPPEDRQLLETWRQRLLPYTSQVKVKMDAPDNISVNIKCSSREEADRLISEIEKIKS